MGKDVSIANTHKAPMLLASIDPFSSMEPIAAALRTKDTDDLSWEFVSTTLIDEYNAKHGSNASGLKSGKRKRYRKRQGKQNILSNDGQMSSSDESVDIDSVSRALAAAIQDQKCGPKSGIKELKCEFCHRRGHTEDNCYLNPDNPNNKLSPKMKERMMVTDTSKKKSIGDTRKGKISDQKVELAGVTLCTNTQESFERTTVSPPNDLRTYYDSGATSHVFNSETVLKQGTLTECIPCTVLLADKSSVVASKRGEVIVQFENADIRLTKVLLIPGLGYNLVSVGRLADNGIESLFRKDDVMLKLKSQNFVVGHGTRDISTGLYALPTPLINSYASAVVTSSEVHLWHRRLAHLNMTDLLEMHKHADGIPVLKRTNDIFRACRLGKAHKLPFVGHFRRADKVGDIVHSDIIGPLEPSYRDQYRYFATFQDDHLRYNFAVLMRKRSDLYEAFKIFLVRFHDLCSTSVSSVNVHSYQLEQFMDVMNNIKELHSDQAKEYLRLGHDLGEHVKKSCSPPYTPQLNAIAERVNRTIGDASRSMLIQANFPTCLWPFAVKHAVFVRNHIQHSATKVPPILLMTGKKLNLKNIRVFGCAVFVLKIPEASKFEARAREGVLLEVLDHGVYKVRIKDENGGYIIVHSRHVTFDENSFPGAPDLKDPMTEEVPEDRTWQEGNFAVEFSEDDIYIDSNDLPEHIRTEDKLIQGQDTAHYEDHLTDYLENGGGGTKNLEDNNENISLEDNQDFENDSIHAENTNGDDEHDNSDLFEDGSDNYLGDAQTTGTMENSDISANHNPSRYPRRIRRPPSDWYASASISTKEIVITTGDDPTLSEAMNASPDEREAWLNEIDEEFKSIDDNDSWEPSDEPDGMPLPTHPVLHIKRTAEGDLERFKARIVAGGNHQVYGQDYFETYAPVADFFTNSNFSISCPEFTYVCCPGGYQDSFLERSSGGGRLGTVTSQRPRKAVTHIQTEKGTIWAKTSTFCIA